MGHSDDTERPFPDAGVVRRRADSSHGGHAPVHSHDGHAHGAALARAGERFKGRLAAALAVIGVFFVIELVAGILTNSLALLSDAGHMFTDVLGLAMALAAITLAGRFERRRVAGRSSEHTFGLYRLEILSALLNAVLLFGVALWVLVEAVRRFSDAPEVLSTQMFIVAVLGLAANAIAFLLLREGSRESLNLRGAYLEVVADAIGSVGVIMAAALVHLFGWLWADPVIAAAIGLWILPRTWRLGRQAVHILLQAVPTGLDLDALRAGLHGLEDVIDVHDLHAWTLTSGMDAVSAHLVVSERADMHSVLDRARQLTGEDFGIDHSTFQVEPVSHRGCHEVTW